MEAQLATKTVPGKKNNSTRNAMTLGLALLVVIAVIGLAYWKITQNQVYTDKADIEAPSITISAQKEGVIQKILVSEGQKIPANTSVAQVSDQILKNKDAGIVISAEDNVGKTVTSGEPIVTLIDPSELRVVAHLDEDKGLRDVQVGQNVLFTIDAYGSKKYFGVVDAIGSTSRQSGIVFNISDQREVKQFDVKIRFNPEQYPELKNGMSAKVTIYTK